MTVVESEPHPIDFAVTNGLSTTQAFSYRGMLDNPKTLGIAIAEEYASLRNISDTDLYKAIGWFTNAK